MNSEFTASELPEVEAEGGVTARLIPTKACGRQ